MFPRSVSTTRRVHARVYTLKDGCLHTFWQLDDRKFLEAKIILLHISPTILDSGSRKFLGL